MWPESLTALICLMLLVELVGLEPSERSYRRPLECHSEIKSFPVHSNILKSQLMRGFGQASGMEYIRPEISTADLLPQICHSAQ